MIVARALLGSAFFLLAIGFLLVAHGLHEHDLLYAGLGVLAFIAGLLLLGVDIIQREKGDSNGDG